MRRLAVFNSVSLDGYFTDQNSDMDWAHKHDPEWSAFVADNSKGESQLVFGRITYDQMAGFWPTAQAIAMFGVVAERLNSGPKVVFSRTLDKATWNNTRLVKGDVATEMRKLKLEPGPDMVILGSGSIVAQLAAASLVDQYQIVISPIVLGKGRTLFEGLKQKMPLKLTNSRTFQNGNVFLCYEPTA